MATFVLVPGAWLGAWCWKKVTPLLEKKGHQAFPVTLTGMGDRVHLAKDAGMETAIQDVLNVIHYNDLQDIILVGHSFAGKVVAPVADRESHNVKMILYLDAFRPDKLRTPQGGFDPKEYGPPVGLGVPFNEKVLEMEGKDVHGPDRKWMLSKATPWPIKLAHDPITLSENFDRIKSSYVFCTLSSDGKYLNDILKGKWGAIEGPHKVIEAGHWPMITTPEEVVDALISLTAAQK